MATATTPARRETFGDRLLRAIREKDGPVAVKPAAEWLGEMFGIDVSGTQILKYRNKDEKPRLEQGCAYAEALDVCVEWLYTGRGPMRPMDPLSEDEERLVRLIRDLDPAIQDRVVTELTGYVSVRLGGGPIAVPRRERSLAASARTPRKKGKR